MKDTLKAGIAAEVTVTTTAEMGVSHLGAGPGVLSTPSMISLMEYTAMESIVPHLDTGEQSVGTMVHVWHKAAVKIGEAVQCRTRLMECTGRRLLFAVEVQAGQKKIGEGTHERFVIALDRFNA